MSGVAMAGVLLTHVYVICSERESAGSRRYGAIVVASNGEEDLPIRFLSPLAAISLSLLLKLLRRRYRNPQRRLSRDDLAI